MLIQKCVFNIFAFTIHIIQKVSKFYLYRSGDNPEKIWAHCFFFFAARGMEGVVIPPGGPRRCPGGNKAPDFIFFCIKHTQMVIFRVNIG